MADIRDTDPNDSGHRRARFRIGWHDAIARKDYGPAVLEDLTWQNTGYRLGVIFEDTTDDLIDDFYDLAVAQQAQRRSSPGGDGPVPDATESHPYGFPVESKFPGCTEVRAGEGERVLIANTADRFQVIVDSGTLADFLDPEIDGDMLESLVTVHHFNDEAARDSYLAERFPEG